MRTLANDSGLAAGIGVLVVIYLAFVVLMIVAWVKILQKAGYSGAWVLIALVPLLNVIMFLVFAFSKWPVLVELDAARGRGGYPGAYPQPYPQQAHPQQYPSQQYPPQEYPPQQYGQQPWN